MTPLTKCPYCTREVEEAVIHFMIECQNRREVISWLEKNKNTQLYRPTTECNSKECCSCRELERGRENCCEIPAFIYNRKREGPNHRLEATSSQRLKRLFSTTTIVKEASYYEDEICIFSSPFLYCCPFLSGSSLSIFSPLSYKLLKSFYVLSEM